MAQIVVRNIEQDVKDGLKRRAFRHGCSMEEEVRQILRNALTNKGQPDSKLGSRISTRFAGQGLIHELPEFHGQSITPMDIG